MESRNPAKSRPLSANVKRLMRLARASPINADVVKVDRAASERDIAYCRKQGDLFMEASSMGFKMDKFAPMFMTSQLAGLFDVAFAAADGIDNYDFAKLLQIPVLLEKPRLIVETLYWIDDIIARTTKDADMSLVVAHAYIAEERRLPAALAALPATPNRNVDELAYAYWLGYIYRCECLLHEESSRMVYGAFSESVMRNAYAEIDTDENLSDCAIDICKSLDSLLVEKIWPEKEGRRKRLTKDKDSTPLPAKQ